MTKIDVKPYNSQPTIVCNSHFTLHGLEYQVDFKYILLFGIVGTTEMPNPNIRPRRPSGSPLFNVKTA